MTSRDNQYQRKARYTPNREIYVNENGNYVYLIWDEELQDYRHEVIAVGDGSITPNSAPCSIRWTLKRSAAWIQITTTSTRSLKLRKKTTVQTKAVTPRILCISFPSADSAPSRMPFVKILASVNCSSQWRS